MTDNPTKFIRDPFNLLRREMMSSLEKVEEKWEECDISDLQSDIKSLTQKANKETLTSSIDLVLAKMAVLHYGCRTSESEE